MPQAASREQTRMCAGLEPHPPRVPEGRKEEQIAGKDREKGRAGRKTSTTERKKTQENNLRRERQQTNTKEQTKGKRRKPERSGNMGSKKRCEYFERDRPARGPQPARTHTSGSETVRTWPVGLTMWKTSRSDKHKGPSSQGWTTAPATPSWPRISSSPPKAGRTTAPSVRCARWGSQR